MNKLLRILGIQPKLSQEALDAYFNRLPEQVQVDWFRSGEFIVGQVTADGQNFMTQGKDAEDFIGMVNDAIFTYNEIPEEYRDMIKFVRVYNPPVSEKEKLNNISIKKSLVSLHRGKEPAKLKVA